MFTSELGWWWGELFLASWCSALSHLLLGDEESKNTLDSLCAAWLLSSSSPKRWCIIIKRERVWRNLWKDTPISSLVGRDTETPSCSVVHGRYGEGRRGRYVPSAWTPVSLPKANILSLVVYYVYSLLACLNKWFLFTLKKGMLTGPCILLQDTHSYPLNACTLPLKPCRLSHFKVTCYQCQPYA